MTRVNVTVNCLSVILCVSGGDGKNFHLAASLRTDIFHSSTKHFAGTVFAICIWTDRPE